MWSVMPRLGVAPSVLQSGDGALYSEGRTWIAFSPSQSELWSRLLGLQAMLGLRQAQTLKADFNPTVAKYSKLSPPHQPPSTYQYSVSIHRLLKSRNPYPPAIHNIIEFHIPIRNTNKLPVPLHPSLYSIPALINFWKLAERRGYIGGWERV